MKIFGLGGRKAAPQSLSQAKQQEQQRQQKKQQLQQRITSKRNLGGGVTGNNATADLGGIPTSVGGNVSSGVVVPQHQQHGGNNNSASWYNTNNATQNNMHPRRTQSMGLGYTGPSNNNMQHQSSVPRPNSSNNLQTHHRQSTNSYNTNTSYAPPPGRQQYQHQPQRAAPAQQQQQQPRLNKSTMSMSTNQNRRPSRAIASAPRMNRSFTNCTNSPSGSFTNSPAAVPPIQNPTWFAESGPQTSTQYNPDDDDDNETMITRDQALRPSAINQAKNMTYPTGDVTIIYTDVQGSTSLWESCPSDMKKAQDIHDDIMRRCYANHSGYEITTEGDAFNLAFQYPIDALAFALQAQLKLYKADWPPGILKHDDGKQDDAFKFRGFRVRFGIHHGPTSSHVHEMTGRMVYSGEAVKIAKAVEGMCHGGQILTTMETWKVVSGMAERCLGRPQVLDCGEHLLFETTIQNNPHHGMGGGTTTTRYKRRIMQLVPSDLAFDFFEARGRREVEGQDELELKDASFVQGRLFPPVISKKQLTTSFLNAPYTNGRVTICFVYTVGLLDQNPQLRARNLAILSKCVRKQLFGMNPPGYECQEEWDI